MEIVKTNQCCFEQIKMKVLSVFTFSNILWAAVPLSTAEQLLHPSCLYVEDPNDVRLEAVSYLRSKIQCAVFSQQNGYDLMNFQDGICKLGFSAPSTSTASASATSTATSTSQATAVTPTTRNTMTTTTTNLFACISKTQYIVPQLMPQSANVTTCTDSATGKTLTFVPGKIGDTTMANTACISIGKKLAPLQDSTVNNMAKALIRLFPTSYSGFWTGGSHSGGAWVWNLLTPFSYTDWCSGEPHSTSCVMLQANLTIPCWASVACSTQAPYICTDF